MQRATDVPTAAVASEHLVGRLAEMRRTPPDREFPEPEDVGFGDSATVVAALFTPEESAAAKGIDQPGLPEGLLERPDGLPMVECVRV